MMLQILIGLAAACGLTAVVCYGLYIRAHMREDEAKEARYLQIHYIALFLLFMMGIVIMFYYGEYSD